MFLKNMNRRNEFFFLEESVKRGREKIVFDMCVRSMKKMAMLLLLHKNKRRYEKNALRMPNMKPKKNTVNDKENHRIFLLKQKEERGGS